MKYLILILAALCIVNQGFSQDSISIRTEIDIFTKANYVGEYDYQFVKKEARKSLFKMGMMPNTRSDGYAYERKLAKDISINITFNGGFSLIPQWQYGLTNEKGEIKNLGISIEPRWYYAMRKGIKNGVIADNLEGHYFGIRQGLDAWMKNNINVKSQAVSEITYGIQKRILSDRFIDFNIGSGLKYDPKTPSLKTAKFAFSYRLSCGILIDKNVLKAIKKGKLPAESAKNHDALVYFEDENHLLKIDILSLFRQLDAERRSSKIGIAYEQKIGKSAWTIDTRLSYEYFSPLPKTESGVEISALKSVFQAGIMPRYYAIKKASLGFNPKRITGVYLGINADVNYGKLDSNRPENTVSNVSNFRINPVVGGQFRVLKNLYGDFWYGYGLIQRKADNKATETRFGSVLNMAFGLVF
jgi:hypothetical protein